MPKHEQTTNRPELKVPNASHFLTQAPAGGAVHLFDGDSGQFLRTYTNPDPKLADQFGNAIAVRGNNILVGTRGDDGPDDDLAQAGAVYLINLNSGSVLETFYDPEQEVGGAYGMSVAFAGDDIVIGKGGDSYLYRLDKTLADIPIERVINPIDQIPGTYRIGVIDDVLRINLRIQLTGDEPGEELKRRWEYGAEDIWNNQFIVEDGSQQYPIVIDVEFVLSDPDVFVKVEDGCDRYHALKWCTSLEYNGQPAPHLHESAAAHEVGHLLGLYDEYLQGLLDPDKLIPIIDPFSIMGSLYGRPKKRHYAHFLDWLNGKTERSMVLAPSPYFDEGSAGPPFLEDSIPSPTTIPEPRTVYLLLVGLTMLLAKCSIRSHVRLRLILLD